MAPELRIERASAVRNYAVIRATQAQTAMLKASYIHSNTPTQEQLAEMSKQTGLPQKWINQWFGRQRSKERNSKVPRSPSRSVSNHSGSPGIRGKYTHSGPAHSPEDTIQIKAEAGDRDSFLSFNGTLSGSEHPGTISASSSIVDDPPPPVATGSVTSKKNQKGGPVSENKAVSITLALRSRTKKDVVAQGSRVKKETAEPSISGGLSAGLQLVPQDQSASIYAVFPGAGYSQAATGFSETQPTAPVHHHALLPMIRPAKRSPITTVNLNRRPVSSKPPSSLSNDQSIYYTQSSAVKPQSETCNSQAQASFQRTRNPRTQRTTPYQQGPAFHTQFQNNGPSDFFSNDIKELTRNGNNSGARPENIPCDSSSEYMPQTPLVAPFSLAPAFSWDEHVSSGPKSFALKAHNMTPLQGSPLQNLQDDNQQSFRSFKNAREPQNNFQLQSGFSKLRRSSLDLSVAPEKHLLDILDEFRDENGQYILNDQLVARLCGDLPPFQKAMGLVLLSKLGLEWSTKY